MASTQQRSGGSNVPPRPVAHLILCAQAADEQTVELERREARPPTAAHLCAPRGRAAPQRNIWMAIAATGAVVVLIAVVVVLKVSRWQHHQERRRLIRALSPSRPA